MTKEQQQFLQVYALWKWERCIEFGHFQLRPQYRIMILLMCISIEWRSKEFGSCFPWMWDWEKQVLLLWGCCPLLFPFCTSQWWFNDFLFLLSDDLLLGGLISFLGRWFIFPSSVLDFAWLILSSFSWLLFLHHFSYNTYSSTKM